MLEQRPRDAIGLLTGSDEVLHQRPQQLENAETKSLTATMGHARLSEEGLISEAIAAYSMKIRLHLADPWSRSAAQPNGDVGLVEDTAPQFKVTTRFTHCIERHRPVAPIKGANNLMSNRSGTPHSEGHVLKLQR